MNAIDVIRWGGGPTAVLGGGLLGFGQLITAVGKRTGNQPLTARGEILIFFGNVALIFGLTALYAHQLEPSGVLGLIGYALATIGSMGLSPSSGLFEELIPEAKPLIAAGARKGFALFLAIAPAVSFVVGYVLFGAVTIQARVLPAGAGVTMVVGAVLLFAGAGLLRFALTRFEPSLGPWLRGSGGLLVGLGIARAGISVIVAC